MRLIDMTGQRHYRYVLLERLPPTPAKSGGRPRLQYRCLCDCGKEFITDSSNIRKGNTKSCGCYRTERLRQERKPAKEVALGQFVDDYSRRARDQGIPWALSRDELSSLIFSPCHYCGNEGRWYHTSGERGCIVNGVDRVDSDRGYRLDNVVPCCSKCNYAKKEYPLSDFLSWARQLAQHQGWLNEP